MRVFITGVTGSGKTTLCNILSKSSEYKNHLIINFDRHVNYNAEVDSRLDDLYSILNNSKSYIIDALPFLEGNDFNKFVSYLKNTQNEPTVLYIVFCEKNYWLSNRVPMKQAHISSLNVEPVTSEVYSKMYDNFFEQFELTYKVLSPYFSAIKVFDSEIGREINLKQFQSIYFKKYNSMLTRDQLLDLLHKQTYDKYYQDIEVVGFKGYSDSSASWERIDKLGINWQDKIVCDLGCFHGYFAFKVEQSGASKVYGLERSPDIVNFARELALTSKSSVDFLVWQGGEPTPKCDIALVLNMLHHCNDQDSTLENINCEYAIFEINPPQIDTVSKYFEIISTMPGREYENIPNRVIVYGKKLLKEDLNKGV